MFLFKFKSVVSKYYSSNPLGILQLPSLRLACTYIINYSSPLFLWTSLDLIICSFKISKFP